MIDPYLKDTPCFTNKRDDATSVVQPVWAKLLPGNNETDIDILQVSSMSGPELSSIKRIKEGRNRGFLLHPLLSLFPLQPVRRTGVMWSGGLIWHWSNDIMSKGQWFEHCHLVNPCEFSLQTWHNTSRLPETTYLSIVPQQRVEGGKKNTQTLGDDKNKWTATSTRGDRFHLEEITIILLTVTARILHQG